MKAVIRRIVNVWNELGYAQRRLFEIQTGVPVDDVRRRRRARRTIKELEALYSVGDPWPADERGLDEKLPLTS
jgi:hypothetical protein